MRGVLSLPTKAAAPGIRLSARRSRPLAGAGSISTFSRLVRRDFTTSLLPRYSNTPQQREAEMEGGSSKSKTALKIPKGTRDWMGADIILRDQIFTAVGDVFKRHGATPLDTPVFELKDILAGKYGEDSRLIYDLADQGGEICALRYDLTVPFARWLAMNNVQNIKRYQISKVYRRDQPAIARGRMREFYQCDFDIAGDYDPMIPDAEILRIIVEAFAALGLRDDVTIKLNHRKILDGIFAVVGVPSEMIRTISSAVDKLDKQPWEEVKKEMVEKGLAAEVADEIGEFTKHSGGLDILGLLRADARVAANEKVKQGLDEMEALFSYLEAFKVADRVSFDLSLARGLDYYTGVIFEAVVELPAGAQEKGEPRIGSIAAGGRYDNLVGMYGKRQIPCVGVSFGVDRIFTILKARREGQEQRQRPREVDVFVMAFGGKGFTGLLVERMTVARELWDAGIRAEFAAKAKPRLPQQFKAAETSGVPFVVILGEDEVAAGKVKVKEMGLADDHPDKDGRLLDRKDLVPELKRLLGREGN